MSIERDVSELLANFEERRADKWGQEARRVAGGIRESGLLERLDQSGDRVQVGLANLASVIGVAAGRITGEIAKSNAFLSGIADTLRNPLATVADERYRRGINALNKSWLPEAIDELNASIESNRYFSPAHAALGIAYMNNGQLAEAVECYRSAIRYATPDEPQIATGCALLASSALEAKGATQEAIDVLHSAQRDFPTCAEVALTYSRLSGDSSQVKNALWWAPELATVAVASGSPQADQLAEVLALAPDGPVTQAKRLRDAVAIVRATARSLDVPPIHPREHDLESMGAPEAMLVAGEILREGKRLARLAAIATTHNQSTDVYQDRAWAEATERHAESKVRLENAESRHVRSVVFITLTLTGALIGVTGAVGEMGRSLGPFLLWGALAALSGWLFFVAVGLAGDTRDASRSARDNYERLSSLPAPPLDQDQRQERDAAIAHILEIGALRERRLVPWSGTTA